jgi:hypothetical protein
MWKNMHTLAWQPCTLQSTGNHCLKNKAVSEEPWERAVWFNHRPRGWVVCKREGARSSSSFRYLKV